MNPVKIRTAIPHRLWHSLRWAALGCLVVSLGCQQGGSQVALPTNPLVGSTRVPPPQTGRVGGQNPYVQNAPPQSPQSFAGMPTSDLMAQSNLQNTPTLPGLQTPTTNGFVPSMQGNANPLGNVNNYAMANAALPPQVASPALAVQQAGYAQTDSNAVATSSFGPQLRGMPVNDLTPAGQQAYAAQPAVTPGAPLVPVNPALANAQPWQPNTVGAYANNEANQTLPAPPGNVATDSWNVVGSGISPSANIQPTMARSTLPQTVPVQASPGTVQNYPTTNPAPATASNANLPWRAPTTAR